MIVDLVPPRSTPDAVVVVPGILGSTLRRGRETVWGLDPTALAGALRSGLATLDATAYLEGRDDGIRPDGLIAVPGYIPVLKSLAPYRPLVDKVQSVVRHRDAILEFAYDWRLPARANAKKLADACETHLRNWRAHPKGDPVAKLRFVCHSMGGIVALAFCALEGGYPETQQIITIGTPFLGAVRAAQALADGDLLLFGVGASSVRSVARSWPAMYELLPRDDCLRHGVGFRQPTIGDFEAIGIPADLTTEALAFRHALGAKVMMLRNSANPLDIRSIVGNRQATPTVFSISHGEAQYESLEAGELSGGDGTVSRESAFLPGTQPAYHHQRHVALAIAPEVLQQVCDSLTEHKSGRVMGDVGVSLEVPPVIERGGRLGILVRAPPARAVRVAIKELGSPARPSRHAIAPATNQFGYRHVVLTAPSRPGIAQISAEGAGGSPTLEYVLVQ